jgi:hypothetical protein
VTKTERMEDEADQQTEKFGTSALQRFSSRWKLEEGRSRLEKASDSELLDSQPRPARHTSLRNSEAFTATVKEGD